MCSSVYGLVRFLTVYEHGVKTAGHLWNVLAVLLMLRAFFIVKTDVGMKRGGSPGLNVRVRFAFLPFVNWKPHVPEKHWAAIGRANRHIQLVIGVYLVLMLVYLLLWVGLSRCEVPPGFLEKLSKEGLRP